MCINKYACLYNLYVSVYRLSSLSVLMLLVGDRTVPNLTWSKTVVTCKVKHLQLEKVALDGSVECCSPPPRWCDLEL